MNVLTHLDLFSGIGGFALAAGRAGFRTVGFSEVEPYACRVLAERFPGVPNLGDVRKRKSFAELGSVTVLTGGFPCQPWSTAGRQRGTKDDRHLWPAMLRVIETVRPSWVIGENVSGIINLGLDQLLDDLENTGYSSQPFVIPACSVGAWHRRDRLWVIAHDDRLRKLQSEGGKQNLGGRSVDGNSVSQNTPSIRQPQPWSRERIYSEAASKGQAGEPFNASWWSVEPELDRVANGIPDSLDRLKGLGNAIVPQVVEPFFHWIAQLEARSPV